MLKFKTIMLSGLFASAVITACGRANDYDAHADDHKDEHGMTDSVAPGGHDTIQGRSATQRDTGIEESNVGIGDTSIQRTQ